MFRGVSIADFDVDGHKAQFIIDNKMPVESVQAVLNKIMHFCVERLKEAEDAAEQIKKDEEANKVPKLEEAKTNEE